MDQWTAVGLGLDYGVVRHGRVTDEWLAAAADLRDHIERILDLPGRVEHIGSSAVHGLLAKPIIDLAVGIEDDDDVARVETALLTDGWIYRGDSGDSGGRVFVLDSTPWHRVAHLHAVEFGGEQWSNYVRLRELLRASPVARGRYEAVKLRLADQHPDDRRAYTDGKTDIVTSLLDSAD